MKHYTIDGFYPFCRSHFKNELDKKTLKEDTLVFDVFLSECVDCLKKQRDVLSNTELELKNKVYDVADQKYKIDAKIISVNLVGYKHDKCSEAQQAPKN